MDGMHKLTTGQEDVLVAVMLTAGIDRGTAESVITEAAKKLTGSSRPGNVSVTQQAHTVEAGATVIGYQVDSL